MGETDLLMMTLGIFLPAAFALALLLFPRRWAEAMRWWALFGTAATLIVGLCTLIDYYAMLDSRLDRAGNPLHDPKTQLEERAAQAMTAAASPVPGPRLSYDWVARVGWIDRFNANF